MIDQPLHTPEPHGLPPPCTHHPDIDQLGVNCRISPYASVMRGDAVAGRGLFLGDGVMLFRDVRLVLGSLQEHPQAELRLGNNVTVNVGSFLSGEGGLVIEDEVLIGAHVKILSAGHQIDGGDDVVARNAITYGRITIGRGAWIGAGATVLPGVQVGAGAVVGAGSVVTQNVPAMAVVVGNPARLVRMRQ